MLILVAVTITMAINGGLFDYAGKATGDTKNAINAEQELANGRIKIGDTWYDSIGDYLNNVESKNQQDSNGQDQEGIIDFDGYYLVAPYNSLDSSFSVSETGVTINFGTSALYEMLTQQLDEETLNKITTLTDEEIFAILGGWESFESCIQYYIGRGHISEEYSTLKEFLKHYDYEYTGDLIDTDEEYNAYVEEMKKEYEKLKENIGYYNYAYKSFFNSSLEIASDDLDDNEGLFYIYGTGDYIFSVKISGEEKFKFKVTIDKYEIIEDSYLYILSAYDFENEKFLEINQASHLLNGEDNYVDDGIDVGDITCVVPPIGFYYFSLTCESNNFKVDGFACICKFEDA